jgi:hypothetical protein
MEPQINDSDSDSEVGLTIHLWGTFQGNIWSYLGVTGMSK